jgi:hypothetical protein
MTAFLSNFPELVDQWHLTKNGNLTPQNIVACSGKKVWWKCPKGEDHEWSTSVRKRTIEQTGCPYCSGHKVSKTNCLLTIYPEVAKDWHPNKNGNLTSQNIVAGSGKKVWWKCPKGEDHEWVASPDQRKKSGCPYCSNRRVSNANNFRSVYPELVAYFHPSKNLPLVPEKLIASSSKRIWWICKDKINHEWQQTPAQLSSIQKKCPFCSFRKLTSDNNLKVLFPKISSEFHPTRNKKLKTSELLPNTTMKVWWKCKNGHEWYASINHRTQRNQNCPKCSNQTSIPEIRVFTEIKSIFPIVFSREKLDGIEVDIFIPSIKLAIEYDGAYFHRDNIERDQKKNDLLNKMDIKVIRIREHPLERISSGDVIILTSELTKEILNKLLLKIISFVDSDLKIKISRYIGADTFQNEEEYKKYLSYFPSPFPEKSLQFTNPEIQNLWHEKNAPLELSNFSSGSNQKVWWKCDAVSAHEWEAPISSVVKGHRCPLCTGQRVSKETSLTAKYPDLCSEWHPEKNGNLLPSDFTWGSGKKVWWKCKKGIDHEWIAAIRHRTSNMSKCPFCLGNKLSSDNNFAVRFPDLAQEWHPTKNGDLMPHQVMPGSKRKVWWSCQKNHEWFCSLNKRTSRGQSCPRCKE